MLFRNFCAELSLAAAVTVAFYLQAFVLELRHQSRRAADPQLVLAPSIGDPIAVAHATGLTLSVPATACRPYAQLIQLRIFTGTSATRCSAAIRFRLPLCGAAMEMQTTDLQNWHCAVCLELLYKP